MRRALAFALLLAASPASAHPHVFACRVARDEQTKRPEGIKCSYRRRAP
jgi:ABC-type uncharacterized transport system substrate-binding protein